MSKTNVVTFRLDPKKKIKLKKLAEKDKRTPSNVIKSLVDEYIDQGGKVVASK